MRSAFLLLMGAGAAHAGTFTPPKGCSAYLTVQGANCVVEHHWTCKGDAAGDKWHGEVDQNGQLIYMGKVNNEAQWVDSYYLPNNEREQLIDGAADPASLTELFATGLDTYDFSIDTPRGVQRVVGFDRIVERDVRIDGEPLHRTEYDITITDQNGEVTYASVGNEYVSETYRRFFSGFGEVTAPDAPYRYKANPIEFIYPGEKGYLDNTPKYGCDVLNASFAIKQ